MEISGRFANKEHPADAFGPAMREHQRIINGRVFLFAQRINVSGAVDLITVCRPVPGGYDDFRCFG